MLWIPSGYFVERLELRSPRGVQPLRHARRTEPYSSDPIARVMVDAVCTFMALIWNRK